MKKRRLAISAALLAGAIMSSAVPAHAATTPVSGTTTTFDKYLVMKKMQTFQMLHSVIKCLFQMMAT